MLNIFRKKEEPYISILAGTEDDEFLTGKELRISAVSDVGFVRQNNEDNFYADGIGVKPKENCSLQCTVTTDKRRIFAVCDGMGGEAFGDIASEISVSALEAQAELIRNADKEDLSRAVNLYSDSANDAICRMTVEKQCGRSGSTLALVCVEDGFVYCYNLGDSRIYYYSGGNITQLSQDHTLAAQKLRAGIYNEEEARSSSDAHKLITFLGVDDDRVGLKAFEAEPIELSCGKILICSDGLTDMCLDYEIAMVLSEHHDNYAEALAEKALEKGGWDNTTCIVIEAL